MTPFNDDGRVPWTELSGGEKTSRAVQQTFNFGMVLVGMALTVRTTLEPCKLRYRGNRHVKQRASV